MQHWTIKRYNHMTNIFLWLNFFVTMDGDFLQPDTFLLKKKKKRKKEKWNLNIAKLMSSVITCMVNRSVKIWFSGKSLHLCVVSYFFLEPIDGNEVSKCALLFFVTPNSEIISDMKNHLKLVSPDGVGRYFLWNVNDTLRCVCYR